MELGKRRSFAGTKEIQINNKVITFGNSIICADNISLITISKVSMNMSWIGAIILFYIGVFVISWNKSTETDFFLQVGVNLILWAFAWAIAVILYNATRKEYLVINLNSGMCLYFYCGNREFLNEVVNLLVNCINANVKESITIQFDKCQISGGSFFNKSKFNS